MAEPALRERFLLRMSRRARDAEADVRRAYLRTLRELTALLPMGELERLLGSGSAVANILTVVEGLLDRALTPLRVAVQRVVTKGVLTYARDIPGTQKRKELASLVSRGALRPRVAETLRSVDSAVTRRLTEAVRESVRTIVAQGYERGQRPRTTARELRELIGLSEAELKQVANFRDALLGQNGRRWEDYTKRDHRFDGTVRRAMESGNGLRPEQVDRMVTAYTRRRIALSAEANARTATRDALKQTQKAVWREAIEAGLVDGNLLMKEWVGYDDGRERESHVAMNGEVVAFEALFPNGDDVPGDADPWGCRCWPRYYVARERSA